MTKLLEQIQTESKPYHLSDLVDIKYGFGLPEPKRVTGSIPVYASSGHVGFHNEAKVNKPSIIIGRKGNVGSLYYSNTPSFPIDTAFFIDEPKEGFDLKYIFYLLKSINLPRYGGDSAVPGLSRDTIYSLSIEAPTLPTQNKIAEILSAYDAKIENNNKIIKNLEAIAQTIFYEWFVKFRFPGYEKVKMVESEMGEIPEEWDFMKISEFCETYGGGTPSTKNSEYWENGKISWATPTDMTALGTIFIDKTQKKITQAGLENSSTRILHIGSILMTSRATVGVLAISKIPITTNQGFIACVCDSQEKTDFLFWWLKNNVKMIKDLAGGSTFPEISRGVFRNIGLLIPSQEIILKFSDTIQPFHGEIYLLQRQNVALKESRDQLLAKLV
jgi:type I restriction enzyme S subunit